ncbi:MAG TPA: RNA polymerase sigma-70 factor [Actinomycetota bacterium]|nr:RNA polymerase sigma-70 factor [Actinomycetota bacterium]
MADTDTFHELRGYLFGLAYRMLGSAGDAEDIVQEAYLRWSNISEPVDSPKAFLSKVTTRLCIDHLKSARVQRESYVGPWLPEPVPTEQIAGPEEAAEKADSLSMAFLVVLESLSPTERAVFLLREVFGYDYPEIAEIVDRSEANCRQIAHRAKEHIASRRPRFEASREQREDLMYRFMAACTMGDMDGLMTLLTEDITLFSDGGGRTRAARKPIYGASKVARFLLGVIQKAPEDYSTQIVNVNGQPAIALYEGTRPFTVLSLDMTEDRIQGLHVVVNPDKLARF